MAPYRQPFRRVMLALCAAALVPTSARAQLTMPRTTMRLQSVQPLAQGAAEPLSALERASMEAVEGLERAVERGMEGASRMGLFGVTSDYNFALGEASEKVDAAPPGKPRAKALAKALEVAECLDRVALLEAGVVDRELATGNYTDDEEGNAQREGAQERAVQLLDIRRGAAVAKVSLARTALAERHIGASDEESLGVGGRELALARALYTFGKLAAGDDRGVDDAEKALEEAATLLRRLMDNDVDGMADQAEEMIIDVGVALASLLVRRNEHATAVEHYSLAVRAAASVHGRRHGRTLDVRLELAAALHAANHVTRAEREAVEVLKGARGDSEGMVKRRERAERLVARAEVAKKYHQEL